jgi:transposase
MDVTTDKRRELERAARGAQPAHMRTKALVLLNLFDGRGVTEIAAIFHVSRDSVYKWKKRYFEGGIEGLRVRPGRGRKAIADPVEMERYLRQSPRNFGINRTRWTLSTLASVVPSLKGFSPFGVQRALARAGFSYKRGQPRLHSPDPLYEEKKGLWTRR